LVVLFSIRSLSLPTELKTYYTLFLPVVIKIDLNFLLANFKSIIIQDIEQEYRHHHNLENKKNVGDHNYESKEKDISTTTIDNNHHIITLGSHDDKNDIHRIERMIKDILIKGRIHDYVVIQDAKEGKNQIVIVKRESSERLGIYHCLHCGMAFEDEIQLSNHLRMHYLI
jgi:hypothetical protein